MTERNITDKYKNFKYLKEIQDILDNTHLNVKDEKVLNKIISNYNHSKTHRGYKYIIKDIYILTVKKELSTSQMAQIYKVTPRTIQIWLKELGLNRNKRKAGRIGASNSSQVLNLNHSSIEKNVNTSLEKIKFQLGIANQREQLPKCLIEFLSYLETIKGKSPNTLDAYKIDLTMFFRFIMLYKGLCQVNENTEFQDVDISSIDTNILRNIVLSDLYAFLSFTEKQRDNSAYARARKVATLKSFFKYLYGKAKILDENIASELESPKIDKRNPVYLTLDESKRLLSSVKNSNNPRDYCIITLFLNCGLRISELCSIEISKIKGDTLTVIGKGNKERTVYLNKACLESIHSYLNSRNEFIDKIPFEYKDILFLNKNYTSISKRSVENIVKKYIKKSGLDEDKYTPHKLRHTAATLMYKHGGVDIRSLQKILGHENISTTQIYTHVDDEKLREAIKSNPLSNE